MPFRETLPSGSTPTSKPGLFFERLLLTRRLYRVLAVLLAAMGMVASLFLHHQWQALQNEQAQVRFDAELARAAQDIERRFFSSASGLRSVAAMVLSRAELQRNEFVRYVSATERKTELPGVNGIGLVDRVERQYVARYELERRADGAPDFQVRSTSAEQDAWVVRYFEPSSGHAEVLGQDFADDPVASLLIDRAIDSGAPTLGHVMKFERGVHERPVFLMFVPIYRYGVPLDNVLQRRAAATGLVYAPIDLAQLVSSTQALFADRGLALSISEMAEANQPGAVLFGQTKAGNAPLVSAAMHLALPGTALWLQGQADLSFYRPDDRRLGYALAASGALVSLLLGGLIWTLGAGRARAETTSAWLSQEVRRLQLLAERTNNGVLMMDANLKIRWSNPGFSRMSGYGAEEAYGKTPAELLGSGQADPAVLQTLADAADKGQACRVTILNRAKDGHEYWVDAELQPVRDDKGRLSGFIEIALDVTEARQAQARLQSLVEVTRQQQQELDRLARVARVTHDAVVLADGMGRVQWVNDGTTQILGWSNDDALGRPLLEVLSPFSNEASDAATLDMAVGARVALYLTMQVSRRDGELRWLDVELQALDDETGKSSGLMLVARDVTEKLHAMNQLQQVVRENERLVAAVQEACIYSVTDTHGTIVDVNDAFVRISGYAREELQGANHRIVKSSHHPHNFWVEVWAQITDGQIWHGEVCNLNKDGEPYWVDTTIVPFMDAQGLPEKYVSIRHDITRIKTAQLQLKTQSERLDNILKGTNVGTWEWHVGSGRVEVDERWAEICGYQLEEMANFTIADWQAMTHPEDLAAAREAYEKHVSGRADFFSMEMRVYHRIGHYVWVLDRGQLRSPEPGEVPQWMYGTRMDISARKAAETALRQREARAQLLSELSAEWFWECDDTFRFTRFSGGNEAVIRKLNQQALGRCRWELSGEPVVGTWEEHRKQLERHERIKEFEYRRQGADGVEQVWSISGVPVFSEGGTFTGYIGVGTDITARRQSQERLARGEARLRAIYNVLPLGIAITDPRGVIVDSNPALRRLLADPSQPDTQGAQTLETLKLYNTDGLLMGFSDFPWIHALAESTQVRDAVLELRMADRSRWLSVDATPVSHHQFGVVVAFTDITPLKSQTDALRAAKQQAEQASQFKSQFLANMSHEIRTPMNAIMGMLSLLRHTPLQARQLDYVVKADGASQSLLALINDILDFSKIEAGKLTLDPQPFRTETLWRDLSVIFAAYGGKKDIEILFDIAPDVPPCLLGDVLRIKQVLINLGSNAIKFTSEGEVVVTVRRIPAPEGAEPDVAWLSFSVRDSGIGIAPENQARIFAGFTQAEASTTRRFGGTGLGLSISRRLVELMGGELGLHSALGQGSTFTFTLSLPLVAEREVNVDPAHPLAATPLAPPRRVLVVDDNPVAREIMLSLCQHLGWAAAVAPTGHAAVAQWQDALAGNDAFDLVCLDVNLPDLDGWQVAQAIRREAPAHAGAGVRRPLMLMVTSSGSELFDQQPPEVQALVDGYVVKPLTAGMLHEAWQHACQGPMSQRSSVVVGDVSRPLTGLRLLVVEDNAINQQVAEELLTAQGANVDLADNGQRGVEAVFSAEDGGQRYDAVLMDMQMPVMDGLSATRTIRERLSDEVLPIIAMTANALASDRDACLQAGMNDHIGKPFVLDELVGKLLQWARGAVAVAALTENGHDAAEPASGLLPGGSEAGKGVEHGLLDREGALHRVGGSVSLLDRLSLKFVAELPMLLAEAQHLHSADAAEVNVAKRAVHSIKGAAATVGASLLAQTAAEVEARLRASEPPDLARLEAVARDTSEALQRLAQPHKAIAEPLSGTTGQAPLDAGQRDTLTRLLPMLEASDIDAFDLMEALLEGDGAADPRWVQLSERMDEMDFVAAAAQVRQLL